MGKKNHRDDKVDQDESEDESIDRARVIDSKTLFQGEREVWIRHGREMYRLRLTSSDKLYLSK